MKPSMIPVLLLFSALGAATVRAEDREVKHADLALELKANNLSDSKFMVCGDSSINPRAKNFSHNFFAHPSGTGFLLKGIPDEETFKGWLETLSGPALKEKIQSQFQEARLVLVKRRPISAVKTGPPLSVKVEPFQAYSDCLKSGPKGFHCAPGTERKNCCSLGVVQSGKIALEWKHPEKSSETLEMTVSYQPGGTKLYTKEKKGAGVFFCNTEMFVSFKE